jgi:probable HAF family extracellular repeat protein
MRRCVNLIFVGMLVAAFATAQPFPNYKLTDLGTMYGYPNSHPTAINASGGVVGYSGDDATASFAVLFTTPITDFGFGSETKAFGISDSGSVFFYRFGSDPANYLYKPGIGSNQIAAPEGYSMGFGSAVSSSGQMAVQLFAGADQYIGVYTEGTGWDVLPIPIPPDVGRLNPTGINLAGTIVAHDCCDTAMPWAWGWIHTAAEGWQSLDSLFPDSVTLPQAVSNQGSVVGWYEPRIGSDAGLPHAFLYEVGKPAVDLGNLGGWDASSFAAFARGVNASNQVVGASTTSQWGVNHGFVYIAGTMRDLNDLVPEPLGFTVTDAVGINDNGQIAATCKDQTRTHACLLTPIPSTIPFSSMTAKLDAYGGVAPHFNLKVDFALGAETDGINVASDQFEIHFGDTGISMPLQSFKTDKKGRSSTTYGTFPSFTIRITPVGSGRYTLQLEGVGYDFTGLPNPTQVVLWMGNDMDFAYASF